MKLVVPLLVLACAAWATDVAAPGVPNFHRVDEHVYRGGQPSPSAWIQLANLGIKLVVDLRPVDEHPTGAEAKAVEAAGMQYINVPMKGLRTPADAAIARILALLNSTSGGRVFVHCRRGADRTGTVVACYRIAHDHWQNQAALKEAKSYGMSWAERGMMHYIMNFRLGLQPVSDLH